VLRLSALLSLASASAFAQTAFVDYFDGGVLDSSIWVIDTGNAPGRITGVNDGSFSTANVDLSQGVLALKLTQTGSAPVSSVGAEVRSVNTYGYGTYEWVMRASSTSATPNGSGNVVSGQISSGFTFINNSQTEIDSPEIEGQFPNMLEWTNWTSTTTKQYSSTTLNAPHAAFHSYKFVWQPGRIDFYVDGALVTTHTQNVPSAPAYILMNHWGTNSSSFGGTATVGTTRWLYFSKFAYTPLGPAPPTGLTATVH
jgi:endo-1,3-1,4-beta-glycanase ExoK